MHTSSSLSAATAVKIGRHAYSSLPLNAALHTKMRSSFPRFRKGVIFFLIISHHELLFKDSVDGADSVDCVTGTPSKEGR